SRPAHSARAGRRSPRGETRSSSRPRARARRWRPSCGRWTICIGWGWTDVSRTACTSCTSRRCARSTTTSRRTCASRWPASRRQRIGCAATVSASEEALAFVTGATGRDPIVVDAGFSRDLDVQVVSPVDDFLTATSDTVWDAALQQIAELVQAHRTTLVFAQSRRAAERLARDLNDRIPDGPGESEGGVAPFANKVAAHHGSLSRRARLEAENRLKAGELRALVATSSLELGIDVGSIDLVIQVQSPRNVAAALQPVGRAGHLLSRTSKGRLLVTKGEELLEAAAVVRTIKEQRLDRIAMPEAPLDVLAQQIVAAVAAESIEVDALYARFVNAAPYRALAR